MTTHQSQAIYHDLANKKLAPLFWQYAIPAIIGSTVTMLYNIIDGFFIGHWVGKEALAGLGIIIPIMNITAALGLMVGVGASSQISIFLGRNDKLSAEKIVGTSLLLTLLLSGSLIAVLLIFLKPILMLSGASEITYPYARDFLQIFLPGGLFLTLCYSFNNMMRATGYPFKAMLTLLISVAANIILAPIFIIWLDLGMRGAAIATTLAMIIGSAFVMLHFINQTSPVQIKRENIKLRFDMIKAIVAIGLAPFFVQIASSVIVILVNQQINHYALLDNIVSEDAIAAFANFNRLAMLIIMIVIGVTQGMQPIIGYNFGAQNFLRVKATLFYAIKVATIVTTSGFLVSFFIPDTLVKIFTTDTDLVQLSATVLRYGTLIYVFVGYQIVVSSFFQCIGMARQAIFLSLSRQVVFLIPALILLPSIFGLNGVWLAFPAVDILATLMTTAFLYLHVKRFNQQ